MGGEVFKLSAKVVVQVIKVARGCKEERSGMRCIIPEYSMSLWGCLSYTYMYHPAKEEEACPEINQHSIPLSVLGLNPDVSCINHSHCTHKAFHIIPNSESSIGRNVACMESIFAHFRC